MCSTMRQQTAVGWPLLVGYCVVVVILCFVEGSSAGRVYFEKCEYKGFTCVKSAQGKYAVTFTCNTQTTWDVELFLWQFRSPITTTSLTLANCTNISLNLMCTSENRQIQSVRINNVTRLTLVPLSHGLPRSAPEMIFENIKYMETIPPRTFIQIKRYPHTKYGCSTPSQDLESVVFRNVHVDSIEREAFHNLTDMRNFTMDIVKVNKIHAAAIQVFLAKDNEVTFIKSNFGVLEYLAFFIRGHKITFAHNAVGEMHSNALNATVSEMVFVNNSVRWVHCAALAVLAQEVKILDSSFGYLATGSFQAVGPGLPENSLRGFGRLKFTYEFNNNLIDSLEVGSLHPDWQAYKNVGSSVKVTYNAIKCSCAELAWLGSKEGFGRDFSMLEEFHETVLKMEHNNICSDAPCILPIEAVRLMVIQHGRCMHNITQEYMCGQYYSTTVLPEPVVTKKPTLRIYNSSIPVYKYQKLTTKSGAAGLKLPIDVLIFVIYFFLFMP